MSISSAEIPLIFSTIAFFASLLFLAGVLQMYRRYRHKQEIRGKIRQAGDDNGEFETTDFSATDGGAIKAPILDFLNYVGKKAARKNQIDYSAMRIKFLHAGIRRYNAPAIFWGTKILLALILATGFFLARLTVLKIFDPYAIVVICIFLFVLGLYLPELWLRLRIASRKSIIVRGLPDALDLLVICVESGMGLDAAIHRVAREIKIANPVLSDELRLLNLEMRAGKSRQDALRNLAVRTDIDEINSLVTLLIQTDQFGTSIAKTLRVYSDSFRTRRFQRAEEIAARLPVKLIFPSVLFIFPSLFVVILGPAAIRIYQALLQQG